MNVAYIRVSWSLKISFKFSFSNFQYNLYSSNTVHRLGIRTVFSCHNQSLFSSLNPSLLFGGRHKVSISSQAIDICDVDGKNLHYELLCSSLRSLNWAHSFMPKFEEHGDALSVPAHGVYQAHSCSLKESKLGLRGVKAWPL